MKTITIITRYVVKMNRQEIVTCDSIDAAVKEICDRNQDDIDQEIMSRDDVSADNFEGMDEAAYNRAWEQFEAKLAESVDAAWAYEDGNGHRWSIDEIKAVEIKDIGLPQIVDIEIDSCDHWYGESVMTDVGDYVFIRALNDDKHTNESINVYEAVSLADGHRDVVACDNASCWVVGNEDDHDLNRQHFEKLAMHGVCWGEIDDQDLYDWIEARREEAAE